MHRFPNSSTRSLGFPHLRNLRHLRIIFFRSNLVPEQYEHKLGGADRGCEGIGLRYACVFAAPS